MIKEILNEAKSILSNDIKKGWEIETRASDKSQNKEVYTN